MPSNTDHISKLIQANAIRIVTGNSDGPERMRPYTGERTIPAILAELDNERTETCSTVHILVYNYTTGGGARLAVDVETGIETDWHSAWHYRGGE